MTNLAKIMDLIWAIFGRKNALYHFTLNCRNESQPQPERKKRYFFQPPSGNNLPHIDCTRKVIKPKKKIVMYIYQGPLDV